MMHGQKNIKCTMFIHYLHLLYFSSMFRCPIRHYQGERMCPLLITICCYVANYGFYAPSCLLSFTT